MTKKKNDYREQLIAAQVDYDIAENAQGRIDAQNKIDKIKETVREEMKILWDEEEQLKKQITEANRKIHEKDGQKEAIKNQKSNDINKLKARKVEIQKKYEEDVLEYLSAKIREDRKSKVAIGNTLIEENNTLASLNHRRQELYSDIDNAIEDITKKAMDDIAKIKKDIAKIQSQNDKLQAQADEKNTEWKYYSNLIYPPQNDIYEPVTSFASSSPSEDYIYDYGSTSSNDSQAFEDALRRDREARWKHDQEEDRRQREYERRQKEEQDRKERYERTMAHHAQMRREAEERKEQMKREQAGMHKCSHCVNSAKCSITAKYNSLNCGAYRPR